jgi:hypothetical protein
VDKREPADPLTWIKGEDCTSRQACSMNNFIFKCPQTGMNVHWQADEIAPEQPQCTYETVVCPACGRLHFINRASGKLLGEQRAQQ